jgi:hypothetical protein
LLHLQECRGSVEDPWETPDPDDVEDSLKGVAGEPGLMVTWTETPVQACWNSIIQIDPVELEKLRMHQKMALARYGRQSLLQWGDTDVIEIRGWYEALRDLMKMEVAEPVGEDR